MKYLIYLITFVFVFGCATNSKKMVDTVAEIKIEPATHKVMPGEVFRLKVSIAPVKDANLFCRDRVYPSTHDGSHLIAYVSETYFSKMKPFTCRYGTKGKRITIAKFNVVKKKFPSEKLNVDKKRVWPSKKNLVRIRREQKFLNKMYKASAKAPLFEKSFDIPLGSFVTSIYGSKRIFNNKKQTQHLGTDYRAPIGEPIRAANAGKVVLARDLFYTGNTVTVDHGMGIFTIYGHLSKLNATEGEYVPKGALIGLAGKTGRTTGPHLHWGVKINGHFIEGDSLVRETDVLDD